MMLLSSRGQATPRTSPLNALPNLNRFAFDRTWPILRSAEADRFHVTARARATGTRVALSLLALRVSRAKGAPIHIRVYRCALVHFHL